MPTAGVDCIAAAQYEPDAAVAYAILAGSADGHLQSARFLIDPAGILRSVWRPGDGADWADPNRELEEIRTICTHAFGAGGEDEHRH